MRVRVKAGCAFAVACGGLLYFSTTLTNAADLPVKAVAAPVDLWAFSVTPYFWAPSLSGSSTVKGRTMDVDASFVDIARDSEIPKDLFGLMGTLEARKGPWSLYADLVYMRLARAESGARVRSVRPEVGGTLAASASVGMKMFIGEFGMAYEIARMGSPVGLPGSATAIDLYGGGRVWWQEAEANLLVAAGVTIGDLTVIGGRAIAKSGDVSWVDPLIGVRLRHQLSTSTELVIRGDVGGFGLGSKFSWQAIGTLNWDFATSQHVTWTAVIGYRALYADYAQGGGSSLYEYDILMHGPVLGVTARF